jgi:hypothetical protein
MLSERLQNLKEKLQKIEGAKRGQREIVGRGTWKH